MASLTPLSKGLIALATIGAMSSAVWHLGLKERFDQPAAATAPVPAAPAAPPPPVATAVPTAPIPTPQTMPSVTDNAETGRRLLASGNHAQARMHLEQAVHDGSGSAACLLGEMTLKGQGGITPDQEKAASLFRLAQSRNTICFAPAP